MMLNQKRYLNRKREDESGQTFMEFLVVVMVIIALIFAFIQICWAMAWGHYIHYSTYMAARAYVSGQQNEGQQLEAASNVLRSMVKRPGTDEDLLGNIAPSRVGDARDIPGDEPVPGAFIGTHPVAEGFGLDQRFYSWAEGVQYNFKFKLFILPLAWWLKRDEGKTIEIGPQGNTQNVVWTGFIDLTSDAFLGRENTNEECRTFLLRLSGLNPRSDRADYIYDNGC